MPGQGASFREGKTRWQRLIQPKGYTGFLAKNEYQKDSALAERIGVPHDLIGRWVDYKYFRRKPRYHGMPLLPGEYPAHVVSTHPRTRKKHETAKKAAVRSSQVELERDGVICEDDWQCIELRCAISMQRLNDPAKGSACMHRACCNYGVLREYVGRNVRGSKQCPLATCTERLQRTRDVERDAQLKDWLDQVPPSTSFLWVRGDEMRTSNPRARACGAEVIVD